MRDRTGVKRHLELNVLPDTSKKPNRIMRVVDVVKSALSFMHIKKKKKNQTHIPIPAVSNGRFKNSTICIVDSLITNAGDTLQLHNRSEVESLHRPLSHAVGDPSCVFSNHGNHRTHQDGNKEEDLISTGFYFKYPNIQDGYSPNDDNTLISQKGLTLCDVGIDASSLKFLDASQLLELSRTKYEHLRYNTEMKKTSLQNFAGDRSHALLDSKFYLADFPVEDLQISDQSGSCPSQITQNIVFDEILDNKSQEKMDQLSPFCGEDGKIKVEPFENNRNAGDEDTDTLGTIQDVTSVHSGKVSSYQSFSQAKQDSLSEMDVPSTRSEVPELKLEMLDSRSEVPSPRSEVPSPRSEVPSPRSELPSSRSEILDPRSEIPSSKSEMLDPSSEVPSFRSEMLDLRSEIPSSRSEMLDPRSEIPSSKSEMLDPRSEVPSFRSEMLDPRSEIPSSRSEILDPSSEIPRSKSEMLDPRSEAPSFRSDVPNPRSEMPSSRLEMLDPRSEIPSSMSEMLDPRSEIPRSMSEMLDPSSEIPRSKSEMLDPRSEIPRSKSEMLDPRSEIPRSRSEMLDPRSEMLDSRSEVPRFRSEVPNPRSEIPSSRSEMLDPRSEMLDSRSEVPRFRSEVPNPRSEIPNSRSEMLDPRSEIPSCRSEMLDPRSERAYFRSEHCVFKHSINSPYFQSSYERIGNSDIILQETAPFSFKIQPAYFSFWQEYRNLISEADSSQNLSSVEQNMEASYNDSKTALNSVGGFSKELQKSSTVYSTVGKATAQMNKLNLSPQKCPEFESETSDTAVLNRLQNLNELDKSRVSMTHGDSTEILTESAHEMKSGLMPSELGFGLTRDISSESCVSPGLDSLTCHRYGPRFSYKPKIRCPVDDTCGNIPRVLGVPSGVSESLEQDPDESHALVIQKQPARPVSCQANLCVTPSNRISSPLLTSSPVPCGRMPSWSTVDEDLYSLRDFVSPVQQKPQSQIGNLHLKNQSLEQKQHQRQNVSQKYAFLNSMTTHYDANNNLVAAKSSDADSRAIRSFSNDYVLLKRATDFIVERVPFKKEIKSYINEARLVEYLRNYYMTEITKLSGKSALTVSHYRHIKTESCNVFTSDRLTIENCLSELLVAVLVNRPEIVAACCDFMFQNIYYLVSFQDFLQTPPELFMMVVSNDHSIVLDPHGFPLPYKESKHQVQKAVNKYLFTHKTGDSQKDSQLERFFSHVMSEIRGNTVISTCKSPYHEIEYQCSKTFIAMPDVQEEYLFQEQLSSLVSSYPCTDATEILYSEPPEDVWKYCNSAYMLRKVYFTYGCHSGFPYITQIGLQYAFHGRKVIYTVGGQPCEPKSKPCEPESNISQRLVTLDHQNSRLTSTGCTDSVTLENPPRGLQAVGSAAESRPSAVVALDTTNNNSSLISQPSENLKMTVVQFGRGEHVTGVVVQGADVLHNIMIVTNKGRHVRAHGILGHRGSMHWTHVQPPQGSKYCLQAIFTSLRTPSDHMYLRDIGVVWAVVTFP